MTGDATPLSRHCEPQRGEAIHWRGVAGARWIAAPFGLAMTGGGVSVCRGRARAAVLRYTAGPSESGISGPMALQSIPCKVQLNLTDTDRGVYENLRLTVARHPSETGQRLAARILAYALW